MFFPRALLASAVVLGASLHAAAHAGVTPALGVTGTFARSNVQRPSANAPCASENIAQTINTSGSVTASAAGTFTATAQNFNAGEDGSRQFTAKVDATGTGTKFVAATVTKNGDLAPTNVGTQQLTVSLPAGTKCTGGTGKDLCLVSFTSAAGFGNCVVVKQGAAASGNAAAAGGAAAGAAAVAPPAKTTAAPPPAKTTAAAVAAKPAAPAKAAAPAAAGAAAGKKEHHHHHQHKAEHHMMAEHPKRSYFRFARAGVPIEA